MPSSPPDSTRTEPAGRPGHPGRPVRVPVFTAIVTLTALAALVTFVAPRPTPPTAPAARATAVVSTPGTITAPETRHRYSPFAIRLDGHHAFDVVTFKDVGHPLSDPHLHVDELMAEAFAIALRQSHSGLLTEVVHEPALLDPRSHVFCDRRHLYVDFWQAATGSRWGYSLWSGCGEDDRFAWQEIDAPAAAELATQVERVVDDISRRLQIADGKRCHRREC